MYKDKKKEGGNSPSVTHQSVYDTNLFFLHFLIDNCIYS